MKKIPSPIPMPTGTTVPVEQSVSMLIEAWKDYNKICVVEETKREAIRSNRDVNLAKIKAQRDTLEQYLTGVFKERQQVISGMFDALDKGIEKGDDNLIALSMNTIVNTIKTSPLEGIQNILLQIDDPNIDAIEI